ncbi:peptidyl-prolyl cis-trans isomerase, putative [Plasmodium malariae]|uniref:Peptidyl-prolyl cis-trans isomerase, putative n=1 Tax=Plasmodium malariae TaxID=5858 RepID=A0A1D3PBK4_PLAMA|nr:peptidyl-prolyl cis-trans isomerase, putative [Plasmodium malariae]SCN12640.1 peptidyl-prolyl cis-trans isomerase, putative [Plasmodium malariae]
MTVRTSEDVYKFVKDCIKIKEEIENTKQVTKKEKNICESQNNCSKYNFDYSKFESCIKEIEDEEEEKKKKEENKHNFLNKRNPCSHDHSKERQLYEKDTKEKIKASNAFNIEGKKAFYEKNYKLACVYFRKGLIQLDYSFPESEPEKNEQNQLEINLHLNLALTKFHMSNYYECISECSTVLNLDKNNIKAYYRKGQAYMSLDLYNEAKQEFLKVLEIDPSDNNVKKSLSILKKKILIYNKKNKLVCSKFFSYNDNQSEHSTNDEQKIASYNIVDDKTNQDNNKELSNKYNDKLIVNKENNLEKVGKSNTFLNKTLLNIIDNNYIHKTKNYIFMIYDSSNFYKKYSKFFLLNSNIFFYLLICFLVFLLSLLLIPSSFLFTCYKIFLKFFLWTLSILFIIYYLFIYVYNQGKS